LNRAYTALADKQIPKVWQFLGKAIATIHYRQEQSCLKEKLQAVIKEEYKLKEIGKRLSPLIDKYSEKLNRVSAEKLQEYSHILTEFNSIEGSSIEFIFSQPTINPDIIDSRIWGFVLSEPVFQQPFDITTVGNQLKALMTERQ
jgi:hypothetical protein